MVNEAELESYLKRFDMTEKPIGYHMLPEGSIVKHRWGDGEPVVSVAVSRGRKDNPFWDETFLSVAIQTGLKCWELVELRDWDHVTSIGEGKTEAARACSAPYVFFLDDDDVIRRDCLRKLLDEAISTNASIVNVYGSPMDTNGKSFGGYVFNVGLVKREEFLNLGGFLRTNMCEDIELMVRYNKLGLKRGNMTKVLFYYRYHSGQASFGNKIHEIAEAREHGAVIF